MSRYERYGTRDLTFSNWHRQAMADDADMIDLDGLGYCHDCHMPIYAVETAQDVGQSYKAVTQLNLVGHLLNVTAWLVMYRKSEQPCQCMGSLQAFGCPHGIEYMRVRRVYPKPTPLMPTTGEVFAACLTGLRSAHSRVVCADVSALRIDDLVAS